MNGEWGGLPFARMALNVLQALTPKSGEGCTLTRRTGMKKLSLHRETLRAITNETAATEKGAILGFSDLTYSGDYSCSGCGHVSNAVRCFPTGRA